MSLLKREEIAKYSPLIIPVDSYEATISKFSPLARVPKEGSKETKVPPPRY